MSVEIERKYLVNNELIPSLEGFKSDIIVQGYLSSIPELTIRLRLKNESALLTFKGKTEGIKRQELEIPIDSEFAHKLIQSFDILVLRKKRYYIPQGHLTIELDVFEGKLDGLILAEVELADEDEQFSLPEWFGQEVSYDPAYYNVNLIRR